MSNDWVKWRRLLKVLVKLNVVEYSVIQEFLHDYHVREVIESGYRH